jgi:hypothetical protein
MAGRKQGEHARATADSQWDCEDRAGTELPVEQGQGDDDGRYTGDLEAGQGVALEVADE